MICSSVNLDRFIVRIGCPMLSQLTSASAIRHRQDQPPDVAPAGTLSFSRPSACRGRGWGWIGGDMR